ncbi:BofC C-terminal domain-containing protein [Paenibacillus cymbidii]|uniref:BofC C-terminal domain-containing protein n=1 Tax=Paenibacillus cymbidii TaxID=1639034 RepID=UPI001F2285F5|nr:BofC C-terminal domain-containing protein [Paenibacillus cymbidii]
MSYSNLLKQLKKKLRLKKRWLTLGTILFLAGAAALTANGIARSADAGHAAGIRNAVGGEVRAAMAQLQMLPQQQDQLYSSEGKKQALERIAASGDSWSVMLRLRFVCGEETQSLGSMKAGDVIRYHEEYPTYDVAIDAGNKVVFSSVIEDLSPHCKEHAYFGIDRNGNLSLFDGVPAGEQIIRTFFQLNVQQLKSSLPRDMWNQLYEGIRITDLAEYNSVLSTFSDFALSDMNAGAPPV